MVAIWSGDTGHIGMEGLYGRAVVRSPKPNFLAQMGYHILLPMAPRASAFGARSSANKLRHFPLSLCIERLRPEKSSKYLNCLMKISVLDVLIPIPSSTLSLIVLIPLLSTTLHLGGSMVCIIQR